MPVPPRNWASLLWPEYIYTGQAHFLYDEFATRSPTPQPRARSCSVAGPCMDHRAEPPAVHNNTNARCVEAITRSRSLVKGRPP
jgi:hypothetical protein